ncbi:MAG TPA: glycosyltransferase family 2 protein [Kofleriaceae bacterium]|nr:glycosyltransferase family 2 protein [Kofleriaceae bacterium]
MPGLPPSSTEAPRVSIVIPVFNEEGILHDAVSELSGELDRTGWSYEIILAENGSTDHTVAIGEQLSAELPGVSLFSVSEPNYGRALREGILRARGRFVICDEIDLCDADFHRRAMALLEHGHAEMVVGSKAMKGANDGRPLVRRAATRVMNGLLRVAVDFRGTDTHGLKAFDRERLIPFVNSCVIDRDLFASELVVRAGRSDVNLVEIPVRVLEKRRPAINLARRVPNVLKNLARLTYVIRIKG